VLRDDFSERINRVIRGFAVYTSVKPACLIWARNLDRVMRREGVTGEREMYR
jgi:hypothetical protein